MLRSACELGLEGIIAKNRQAPYRSGRGSEWLKIKCIQSEGFAVIGYDPSTKVPGAIASLLLAAHSGDRLVYVGGVGTGFSHKQALDLRKQLEAMKVATPTVSVKAKDWFS